MSYHNPKLLNVLEHKIKKIKRIGVPVPKEDLEHHNYLRCLERYFKNKKPKSRLSIVRSRIYELEKEGKEVPEELKNEFNSLRRKTVTLPVINADKIIKKMRNRKCSLRYYHNNKDDILKRRKEKRDARSSNETTGSNGHHSCDAASARAG